MSALLAEVERAPATVADLADATGFSRDSVRAQLSELCRLGVIQVIARVPVEVVVTRKTALYAVTTDRG